MPRATNKIELLTAIDQERSALDAFLATLTAEQMVLPGVVGEWSVKDVLAHLVEWEQMLLSWYAAGLRGENPKPPAPGYKWSQLPELNQAIYEKHRQRTLDEIVADYHSSHEQIMALIRQLPDEELFGERRHAWTRNNTLGTYFVSATSSHYLWARNEMRKGIKRKAKTA